MKYTQSNDELEALLAEQLDFLERSAAGYDDGFEGEAKRLAVSARVLVHDTKASVSLLTLLNKKGLLFYDTSAPYDERNVLGQSGLVASFVGKHGSTPVPLLDEGPFKRRIRFDPWWNGVVLVDSLRNEFSRRDVVLALANKEGGAHVDPKLDEIYANLRRNNSLNWHDVSPTGVQTPASDRVPATMRQIAHELLRTLRSGYSYTRTKMSSEGVLVLSPAIAIGGSGPPGLHTHNLPKNRGGVAGPKIGRNDPCVCGSGKKYKKCCIR